MFTVIKDSPACVSEMITPLMVSKSPTAKNNSLDPKSHISPSLQVCEQLENKSMNHSPDVIFLSTIPALSVKETAVTTTTENTDTVTGTSPSIMQLFDQASNDNIQAREINNQSQPNIVGKVSIEVSQCPISSTTDIKNSIITETENNADTIAPNTTNESTAASGDDVGSKRKDKGKTSTGSGKKSKSTSVAAVNEECVVDLNVLNPSYWTSSSSPNHHSRTDIDDVALAAQLQAVEDTEQESGGRARRARKPTKFYDAGVIVKVSYDAQGYEIAPENLELVMPKAKAKKSPKAASSTPMRQVPDTWQPIVPWSKMAWMISSSLGTLSS